MPIVLAIGAVVFTGGAALGLALPTWGAAVTAVFGSTGLGAIAAGAVTWAGYGAVIGAATSAITGKNVIKGMQMGALTGAVSGGILGGVNAGAADFVTKIDPIGQALAPAANLTPGSAAAAGVGNAAGAASAPADAALSTPTAGANAAAPAVNGGNVAQAATTQVAPAVEKAASTSSFWSGAAGPIVGGAITGLGSGLAAPDPQGAIAAYGANYGIPKDAQAQQTSQPATQVANPNGRTGKQLTAGMPTAPGYWRWDKDADSFVFTPTT